MRSLTRPKEPEELKDASRNYRRITSPEEAWKAFGNSGNKGIVRELLEEAQNGLCAYCENSLENNGHIDHFEPKAQQRALTFQWENLVASCTHCDSCGGKKGGEFDADWINPYTEDPAHWFQFYSNGEIKPGGTHHGRAQKVITDFGLDSTRLERKRAEILKSWLEHILVVVDQPEALEYFLQDINTPFPTAREQVTKKILKA